MTAFPELRCDLKLSPRLTLMMSLLEIKRRINALLGFFLSILLTAEIVKLFIYIIKTIVMMLRFKFNNYLRVEVHEIILNVFHKVIYSQ